MIQSQQETQGPKIPEVSYDQSCRRPHVSFCLRKDGRLTSSGPEGPASLRGFTEYGVLGRGRPIGGPEMDGHGVYEAGSDLFKGLFDLISHWVSL